MCCDETSLIIESGRQICRECGLTTPHIESTYQTCSYQQRHCPFSCGYTRHKRFQVLVKHLLFPATSHADESMLKYFFENKLRPKISEIEETMRTSGLTDKRYVCLHAFSRLFGSDYIPPTGDVHLYGKMLQWHFIRFESLFCRKFDGFLSYNFILLFLLKGLNYNQYTPFIKRTKCKRRLKQYNKQLDELNFSFKINT